MSSTDPIPASPRADTRSSPVAIRRLVRRCLVARERGRSGPADAAPAALAQAFEASGRADLWGWVAEAHGRAARPGGATPLDLVRWLPLCARLARAFAAGGDPRLRELAAGARLDLAADLAGQGRLDEAIDHCREAIRAGENIDPTLGLRALGAWARARRRAYQAEFWVRASTNLRLLGHPDAALRALRRVVRRFGSSASPALRAQVARALFRIGSTHDDRGERRRAARAFAALIRRFGAATEPALRKRVALARLFRAVILAESGHPARAAAARRAVARLGPGPGTASCLGWVLDALRCDRGFAEADLVTADPPALLDRLLAHLDGHEGDGPGLRLLVVECLLARGDLLAAGQLAVEAARAYDEVIGRSAAGDFPAAGQVVARARAARAALAPAGEGSTD